MFGMKPFFLKIAVFAVLVCALEAEASDIYRYVEPDGTVVYTNVAPGRKRGAAKRTPPPAAPAQATPPLNLSRNFAQAAQPQLLVAQSGILQKSARFDEAIARAALRYRIPENLVRAVMHAESAFDPSAVSMKGAAGLMQLMPGTARDMFVTDRFDHEANIEGGVRYLRVLANEFQGDMVKMIAAYNAGPEAVRRYKGEIPPYTETQAYVWKVLRLYFNYKLRSESEREVATR